MTDTPQPPTKTPLRILVSWNRGDDAPAQRAPRIQLVTQALRARGFDAHDVDIEDNTRRLSDAVTVLRPHLVFHLVDHFCGDTTQHAAVAGYLDLLGVPYTGSDPLCLASSQDRVRMHVLLRDAGIPVPGFCIIRDINAIPDTSGLRFPVIVTQAFDDSYDDEGAEHPLGDHASVVERATHLFKEFDLPYLVEEYIAHRRLRAVVVGNRVLEVLPLLESGHESGYESGLEFGHGLESGPEEPGGSWRLAQLDHDTLDRVRDMACRAFRVLGCRDVAQVDIHLDPDGDIHVIDIRPMVEMDRDAPFWTAAACTERGLEGVLADIVELARERANIEPSVPAVASSSPEPPA